MSTTYIVNHEDGTVVVGTVTIDDSDGHWTSFGTGAKVYKPDDALFGKPAKQVKPGMYDEQGNPIFVKFKE